ncbi:MAG: phospholipid carrier-dependent glycosyltransferase [Anaerolineae bacterium]|nr:phospholipid carrier-dependent glycosyltransferase [Anaerolineae bacterium]
MQPDLKAGKNRRRALALSLGLFLFAVYLFTYRGGFHSIDEVAMYAVTENMAKLGRFNIDQIAWIQWTTSQSEAQGFFGKDDHVYSKKGLALSLAQAPLYWLALHLPGIGMLQTVSLLNAWVIAATGLLIFMFLHRLKFSTLTALVTALTFGLATIAAVYAKYLFSEPLAGFLLLLAAYMLFAYRQEGGLRHIALAGLAAGFAVVARANNLFVLPVFGLYLSWVVWRGLDWQFGQSAQQQMGGAANPQGNPSTIFPFPLSPLLSPLSVFILAMAIPGAILLGYNAVRSGNPLQTGYDLTLFSPNILLGLYKLLFSPLRGLFAYSPILLLSVPGWWFLRKTRPAEAWLMAGLVGVTIGLFSAWSSGEGLSWGSRFLVPVIPFFGLSLAPIVAKGVEARAQVWRFTFYALLPLSVFIQFLGLAINPWVFLARLQKDFGGEFFLENTAALYNFRYSQIVGQLETWSLTNSDVVWWQPGGFDGLAFGLSLGLLVFSGWFLWRQMVNNQRPTTNDQRPATVETVSRPGPTTTLFPIPYSLPPVTLLLCCLAPLLLCYLLLTRYYRTDQQFGPPNDAYTRALYTAAANKAAGDQIVTVAQNHYHVPMNRFKAKIPLIGLARQTWPPPQTALSLLSHATAGPNVWLVTIGFQPAAPDNAAERWLAANVFKAGDEWLDESVRLVRFATQKPKIIRPLKITLGNEEIQLVEVVLLEALRPGQALPVEFIWLPLAQPQTDYNLFLQLLAADGALAAQHDNPPNGGYSPTSTWQPGRPVIVRHALPLPPDLTPGDYRLITGLYHPTTGERLSIVGGSDFIDLGFITVER